MSKTNKNTESFASKAKKIMANESDPSLQKDLLAQLAQEQEQYKIDNNIDQHQEMSCGGKMKANGGMIKSYQSGGAFNPYINDWTVPITAEQNAQYMNLSNPMIQNPQQLTMGYREMPQQTSETPFFQREGTQDVMAFGMQSLPSIASGLTTYLGNRQLEKDARRQAELARENYSKISAPQQTAQQYNLGRERASARELASEARASANRQLANVARTRGEYLSGASSAATRTQRNLGQALSQSYQKEGAMNQAERARVAAANAQARMAADQFNAQQEARANALANQWLQQAMAYKQGQYGAITGTLGDMAKIGAQNQMISSLGDRYGYQRANWYTPNQRYIQYTGR